jgi:hypothetical protein
MEQEPPMIPPERLVDSLLQTDLCGDYEKLDADSNGSFPDDHLNYHYIRTDQLELEPDLILIRWQQSEPAWSLERYAEQQDALLMEELLPYLQEHQDITLQWPPT